MAPVLLGSGQPAFGLYGLVAPMKMYHLPIVILAGLALCMLSTAQPITPDAEPAPVPVAEVVQPELGITSVAKVISIHDGDTLKVEFRIVADIRLLECWAPEIHGKYKIKGERARDNLKQFVGKNCIVTIPLNHENIGKATSLSRVLGRVSVNGDDLSYLQRKAGHAAKDKEEFVERWPE